VVTRYKNGGLKAVIPDGVALVAMHLMPSGLRLVHPRWGSTAKDLYSRQALGCERIKTKDPRLFEKAGDLGFTNDDIG
jgi:hypothetical protein